MSFFDIFRGVFDGSNPLFYHRVRAFRHHIYDVAPIALANVPDPNGRLVPNYLEFVEWTSGFLDGCFRSRSDMPAAMKVDLRHISPDQGHTLFTQTLVGFIMYAGALNIQAVPKLKSARDALIQFAELTTGKPETVRATKSRFERLSDTSNPAIVWSDYAELIKHTIVNAIPEATMDSAGSLTATTFITNSAQDLGMKLYKAALLGQ